MTPIISEPRFDIMSSVYPRVEEKVYEFLSKSGLNVDIVPKKLSEIQFKSDKISIHLPRIILRRIALKKRICNDDLINRIFNREKTYREEDKFLDGTDFLQLGNINISDLEKLSFDLGTVHSLDSKIGPYCIKRDNECREKSIPSGLFCPHCNDYQTKQIYTMKRGFEPQTNRDGQFKISQDSINMINLFLTILFPDVKRLNYFSNSSKESFQLVEHRSAKDNILRYTNRTKIAKFEEANPCLDLIRRIKFEIPIWSSDRNVSIYSNLEEA